MLLTGRDGAALSRMLRLPGTHRAVEHGRLLLAPGERAGGARCTPAERTRLAAFEQWSRVKALPLGAELEKKGSSRALHVRKLARRDPALARRLLAEAAREARALGLEPRAGRAVLEAELAAGDKGKALQQLYRRTRARGVLYAGDDLTDHPALRGAVELGGLGLFVRSPERPRAPRGCSASLKSQAELAELIARLADTLCGPAS